jgi:phosphoglycerate dehydrogenase-like enzyme
VNTSRGPIVDEQALADALKRGSLAGAGIDVYGEEPMPRDHRLLLAPNTVLTPHLGYVTRESYRVYYEGVVEAIRAWQRGAPVRLLQE